MLLLSVDPSTSRLLTQQRGNDTVTHMWMCTNVTDQRPQSHHTLWSDAANDDEIFTAQSRRTITTNFILSHRPPLSRMPCKTSNSVLRVRIFVIQHTQRMIHEPLIVISTLHARLLQRRGSPDMLLGVGAAVTPHFLGGGLSPVLVILVHKQLVLQRNGGSINNISFPCSGEAAVPVCGGGWGGGSAACA